MGTRTQFTVRCRAVIVHEGKLLTVRHSGKDFLALPGGHMEFGESVLECVEREVIEELGIAPVVGKLLAVNTFIDGGVRQPVEFFFQIENAAEYVDLENMHRTHAHEIDEYVWLAPEDELLLKPVAFAELYRSGKLGVDEVVYLKG